MLFPWLQPALTKPLIIPAPSSNKGNRRPQYYAERRLPLFEDGAGITSGLVRAGWSHGNDKGISTNNTNIPSLSETKSSGKTSTIFK